MSPRFNVTVLNKQDQNSDDEEFDDFESDDDVSAGDYDDDNDDDEEIDVDEELEQDGSEKERKRRADQNSDDEEVDDFESDDDVSAGDYDDDNDDDDEIDVDEELEQDGAEKERKRRAANDDETEPKKKKKKKTTVSRAPPTVEEMTRLRETETLFHSNLFRMQIEELLRQVRTKKRERRLARIWLDSVIKQLAPASESVRKAKVKYPLPELPKDAKDTEFKFEPPVDVRVIGSFNSAICIGPEIGIDVAVVMPKSIFAKEDYLNGRYLRKRARYLCSLAECLLTLDSVDSPRFCLLSSNPLKPVLAFGPSASPSASAVSGGSETWTSKVTVYLHAVPEAGTFKASRFSPEKNNVRCGWWMSQQKSPVDSQGELTPTPHYNYSIARDIAMEANENLQKRIFEENPNLRDALLLLRVWLRQRKLDRGFGSFNGHLLSMYVVYLFSMRKLNAQMSSYQVVRNTWLALQSSDWLTEGPALLPASTNHSAEYHKHYEVVFLDATGFVNLAAELNRFTYLRVKEEAELALKYLDNPSLNSFQVLFLTKMPFLHQYDHVFKVQNHEPCVRSEVDRLLDRRAVLVEQLTRLLSRGLDRRLTALAVACGQAVSWPVQTSHTRVQAQLCSLVVGLRLNSEHAFSVIERGPEANLPQASEFRAFWGDKAELRRFQDGTICESVVWECEPSVAMSRRRLICRTIVTHLLTTKLRMRTTCLTYVADQIEQVVQTTNEDDCDLATAQQRAVAALDALTRQMLDVEDLPLTLAAVQGVSDVVRFCAARAPQRASPAADRRCKAPKSVEPIDAVMQLGLSKKWPHDLAAISRIKAAFYIELANKLQQRCQLIAKPFPNYLIVCKDDYVFRMRVVYQQEMSVMKAVVGEGGVVAYKDNPQSLAKERDLVHLPLITSVLAGLSGEHQAFGSAAALAKRWLRAHMLDAILFPDVVVDLLVAALFVSPAPLATPLQPQTAFLRLLEKLANTNWCTEPQIINFNNQLTREDMSEVEEVFRTGKELGSGPALFLATSYDRSGAVFTRNAPSLPVLYHLARIAQASIDVLHNQLINAQPTTDFKLIFRPPLEFFDWLIDIDAAMNAAAHLSIVQCEKATSKNRNKDNKGDQNLPMMDNKGDLNLPMIDFCPVKYYLQELRANYDEMALFFHDSYGGCIIGVLFKPQALHTREFKVSHFNCREPVIEKDKFKLQLNKEAILEDFKALGKGIVKHIVVNKK